MYESWKTIPGFPNHQISNFGLVRSVFRGIKSNLSLQTDPKGYVRISFSIPGGRGKNTTKKVHRLVCFAFNGPPPDDVRTHVNHKDGNKANNYYKNLEWCRPKENQIHSYRTRLRKSAIAITLQDITNGDEYDFPTRELLAEFLDINPGLVNKLVHKHSEEPYLERWIFINEMVDHIPNKGGKYILIQDYVKGEHIIAESLAHASLLTGVIPATLREYALRTQLMMIGGYVFTVPRDVIELPEHTHKEAVASREAYFLKTTVLVKDYTSGEVATYNTMELAGEAVGIHSESIRRYLSHDDIRIVKGFAIKYKRDHRPWPEFESWRIRISKEITGSTCKPIRATCADTGEVFYYASAKHCGDAWDVSKTVVSYYTTGKYPGLFKKRFKLTVIDW